MISFQSIFFIISKSESKFSTGAYAITLSQVTSEALNALDEKRLNYTGKYSKKTVNIDANRIDNRKTRLAVFSYSQICQNVTTGC